jgi:predicted DCC family thiol-disulfide oxidoreductase YuxK
MEPVTINDPRPLLIYDGDCGFCNYWVRYWQKLTGDRVAYAPYQETAAQYPEIPVTAFQNAIHYIAPDGKIASAAEASFLTFSHPRGKGIWLTLYRKFSCFAVVSELAYAFIAAHRPAFHRLSLLLWGRNFAPPRYDLVSWLFLRGIGLLYLSAFISFAVQAMGLIGSHGILPLPEFIAALRSHLGAERYWFVPMVFWLDSSDFTILVVCWAGGMLSLLLVFGILPRLNLLLLYMLYLSLIYAGQVFMAYQWDMFLVEAGFLTLVLSVAATPGIWLLRWLLFRFMFMSGAVKLLSGDSHWANISALSYHFLTQPLPTPLAWYAAQLPATALAFATGTVFFVELVLPVLIFCPRRLRFVAAFGILLLQICISLTGNYNFFNLQTMFLCLPLFDDAALQKVLPQRLVRLWLQRTQENRPGKAVSFVVGVLALLIVFCSFVQMVMNFGGKPPAMAMAINESLAPLCIINTYGLFAVMTTKREEIVIEGSDDGVEWREYTFKYKPGNVKQRLRWNIPHQPRLDWQMWFAALESPTRLPWFAHFLQRILENSPQVMELLESNPFPDKPPVYVRALYYDYTYASATDKENGVWWNRQLLGLYFPVVSLSRPQL